MPDAARAATATGAAETSALPRWDVSTVWPGPDSPEFEAGFTSTVAAIGRLKTLWDERGIEGGQGTVDDSPQTFDEVVTSLNETLAGVSTLVSYLYAFITTDSRDEVAQGRMSEFRRQLAEVTKLETRLTAWLGRLDVDELLASSEVARAHAFAVRRAHVSARHLMSAPEEDLAADLDLSGGAAWEKLHLDLTSQIEVELSRDGAQATLSITEIRALAHDPDREVRRRAHGAELVAWARNAVPLAAALNSIKGQVDTLSRRRGWETPLDEALHGNNIDRPTLDAMLDAAREAFPELRRYCGAKARLLGMPRSPWYDLFAPVASAGGERRRAWDFATAERFIVEQFARYSDRMSAFADARVRRTLDRRRAARRQAGGAFCMPVRARTSRASCSTSTGSFDGVRRSPTSSATPTTTSNLADRTPLQRQTPMAPGRDGEHLLRDDHASRPASQRRRRRSSWRSSRRRSGRRQVVVDIHSRFLFETRVFERGAPRELSVDELNELDARRAARGLRRRPRPRRAAPVHVGGEAPLLPRRSTTGPTRSGCCSASACTPATSEDPDAIPRRLRRLPRPHGLGDAAELAARFGIDVRQPDFWRASLGIVQRDIERFEALAESVSK